MDNYYLNNAVVLTEDFLENTTNPYYNGEVDYNKGVSTVGMETNKILITSLDLDIIQCI